MNGTKSIDLQENTVREKKETEREKDLTRRSRETHQPNKKEKYKVDFTVEESLRNMTFGEIGL